MTLTATITPTGTAAPTGTVEFFNGSTLLGTGTVANDVATLQTTALAVGNNAVTAALFRRLQLSRQHLGRRIGGRRSGGDDHHGVGVESPTRLFRKQ